MFFTDDDIRRIKDASTGHLLNVVQDFQNLRKSGTSYVCDCPHCKASKKFSVNPAKDIYNCFSCHQIAGVGALDYLTQLYTLLYQRLCIMIGYTNNNEFTPRLTFAHRTYSLDLAERNTKCATISVYLADIASLKIICINWYCF